MQRPAQLSRSRRRLRLVDTAGADAALADDGPERMAALAAAAAGGDRSAFDELVRLTHRDAHGLALRITGDPEDARDVVQEAYLRAYRHIRRFRGDARFSTWLHRIVANCAATHLGIRRRHGHDELPPADAVRDERVDHDPALRADASGLRDEVEAAIRALPPRLRAVVVLRDVHHLPHVDIAEALGISVTAAKVRLHRARRRVREQVLPLPGEERADAV